MAEPVAVIQKYLPHDTLWAATILLPVEAMVAGSRPFSQFDVHAKQKWGNR